MSMLPCRMKDVEDYIHSVIDKTAIDDEKRKTTFNWPNYKIGLKVKFHIHWCGPCVNSPLLSAMLKCKCVRLYVWPIHESCTKVVHFADRILIGSLILEVESTGHRGPAATGSGRNGNEAVVCAESEAFDEWLRRRYALIKPPSASAYRFAGRYNVKFRNFCRVWL